MHQYKSIRAHIDVDMDIKTNADVVGIHERLTRREKYIVRPKRKVRTTIKMLRPAGKMSIYGVKSSGFKQQRRQSCHVYIHMYVCVYACMFYVHTFSRRGFGNERLRGEVVERC